MFCSGFNAMGFFREFLFNNTPIQMRSIGVMFIFFPASLLLILSSTHDVRGRMRGFQSVSVITTRCLICLRKYANFVVFFFAVSFFSGVPLFKRLIKSRIDRGLWFFFDSMTMCVSLFLLVAGSFS